MNDRNSARLVPFSTLYLGFTRDELAAIEADHSADAGHSYSARVSKVVIFSALMAEAMVNEIRYWLAGHLTSPTVVTGFDELSIRRKWAALADAVKGNLSAFTEWRDFETLITLRNALVHPDAFAERPSILKRLDDLRLTQPATDWFESSMTIATASWARNAPLALMDVLREMVGQRIDLHNGGFSWMWERPRFGER